MKIIKSNKSHTYHTIALTAADLQQFEFKYGSQEIGFQQTLRNLFATSAVVWFHPDDRMDAMARCAKLTEIGKNIGIEATTQEHIIDFEELDGDDEHITFLDRYWIMEVRWADPFEAAVQQINFWIS